MDEGRRYNYQEDGQIQYSIVTFVSVLIVLQFAVILTFALLPVKKLNYQSSSMSKVNYTRTQIYKRRYVYNIPHKITHFNFLFSHKLFLKLNIYFLRKAFRSLCGCLVT